MLIDGEIFIILGFIVVVDYFIYVIEIVNMLYIGFYCRYY